MSMCCVCVCSQNIQKLNKYMLMWCHNCQGKIGEPMPDVVCLCACHRSHTGQVKNLHWCGVCVRVCPEKTGENYVDVVCLCMCSHMPRKCMDIYAKVVCLCVCLCVCVHTRLAATTPPPPPIPQLALIP